VTLAAVAHCTIKAERSVAADRLAAAYRSTWWQPTVAGYLGRVSKPLILEAVTEAKGKAAADNIAAMKKGDMADRAADLLTGTGWLPAMLRAA
jgi:ParB family chromosome partitioning protein